MKALCFYMALIATVVIGLNLVRPDFAQLRQDRGLIENRIAEIEKAIKL
jgi:hypothetical protein